MFQLQARYYLELTPPLVWIAGNDSKPCYSGILAKVAGMPAWCKVQ
jgi:hypothetical protein